MARISTPLPWTAFVRSDVYAGSLNDDGERREALSFYVVCENEQGVRYASIVSFTTERFGRDDAEARAEAFYRKVLVALFEGADPRRSAKWTRIQGAYGSAAWSEAAELALEAGVLEDEAGVQEADRFRRAVGLV